MKKNNITLIFLEINKKIDAPHSETKKQAFAQCESYTM